MPRSARVGSFCRHAGKPESDAVSLAVQRLNRTGLLGRGGAMGRRCVGPWRRRGNGSPLGFEHLLDPQTFLVLLLDLPLVLGQRISGRGRDRGWSLICRRGCVTRSRYGSGSHGRWAVRRRRCVLLRPGGGGRELGPIDSTSGSRQRCWWHKGGGGRRRIEVKSRQRRTRLVRGRRAARAGIPRLTADRRG